MFSHKSMLVVLLLVFGTLCQMNLEGPITYYNADKGFGFIRRDLEPDVFFHHSEFLGNEAVIRVGLFVKYTFVIGPNGSSRGMARNVY
jgi:cold shock CspA family protein